MTRILTLASLALTLALPAALAGAAPVAPPAAADEVDVEAAVEAAIAEAAAKGGEEIAVITVTDYGVIRLSFFEDKAPNHVANFKKLARQGFYDGTTFHRVIPRFMIQGGDPLTRDDDPTNDGTGGPGYKIDAEFNDVAHKRGILSMARSNHPDSAGSQFFICVGNARTLDGKYTAFGEVVSGMDVADKIVATKRDKRNDRPLENVVIESVVIESGP